MNQLQLAALIISVPAAVILWIHLSIPGQVGWAFVAVVCLYYVSKWLRDLTR